MAAFGPVKKAKLSLDANHLVGRLEAARDHVFMSGTVFSAGVVYAAYSIQQDLGNEALGGSVLLAGVAGYAAVKLYQHLRTQDRQIEALASETSQEAPCRGVLGFMDLGSAQTVVATADIVRPDLVSAVAARRVRRWEAALDPAYRPPVRAPRQGS